MRPALDHLVIAAADLASGQRWLEERLGVPLQPGGEHALFGTHNALLNMGDAYLEVIAVNPAAPPPARPRWFSLGTVQMQQRLADGPGADPLGRPCAALGNGAAEQPGGPRPGAAAGTWAQTAGC